MFVDTSLTVKSIAIGAKRVRQNSLMNLCCFQILLKQARVLAQGIPDGESMLNLAPVEGTVCLDAGVSATVSMLARKVRKTPDCRAATQSTTLY
jgi:hypothetical protein